MIRLLIRPPCKCLLWAAAMPSFIPPKAFGTREPFHHGMGAGVNQQIRQYPNQRAFTTRGLPPQDQIAALDTAIDEVERHLAALEAKLEGTVGSRNFETIEVLLKERDFLRTKETQLREERLLLLWPGMSEAEVRNHKAVIEGQTTQLRVLRETLVTRDEELRVLRQNVERLAAEKAALEQRKPEEAELEAKLRLLTTFAGGPELWRSKLGRYFMSPADMLDLSYQKLGDVGAQAAAEVLKLKAEMRHILLEGNRIGPEGARPIADALRGNQSLQNLHIHNNPIGPEGAKAIADALKVNRELQFIDLDSCGIGDGGAKAFADAISLKAQIHSLVLANNDIGNEGARALARSLPENKTLRCLSLSNNSIGNEGFAALAMMIDSNSALEKIVLNGNKIDPNFSKLLIEAVCKKRAVEFHM